MNYILKTPTGNTVAVIDDNCHQTKFYKIYDLLFEQLGVPCTKKVEDSGDTLDWDFEYKKQSLTLHYNVFTGVSVYPHHKKDLYGENGATEEIALFLQQSVL